MSSPYGDGYTPEPPTQQFSAIPTPKKKRHILRNIFAVIGGLAVLIIALTVAAAVAGSSGSGSGQPSVHQPNGAPVVAPAATTTTTPPPAPVSTPTPHTARVWFIVKGTGTPTITYGSDADNRNAPGTLGTLSDGNALPFKVALPFDGGAQYYDISAQLEDGGGDITCELVATGPGAIPLVLAKGHASGTYSICDAQASPDDSQGTSWTRE